ncbi:uncharacterized protein [Amphiura filiformis]|uniref:uncharacterized protein n=1 Tax=Amphiura filiformis TaxID=82378 RepID=UPI003B21B827
MDIPKGHCWRCEAPKTDVSCQKCGVAKYCRQKCYIEDVERHRPQCEVWTPKICANPGCQKTDGLKECANCNNTSYCTATCQRQHWPNHKQACKKSVESVKSTSMFLEQLFFSKVGIAPHGLGAPYYIGNAIAVDLLNLQEEEMSGSTESADSHVIKDFSILSAGCGNLRNLIYTITSLPKEFGGKLRVMLNDIDPFVQARNLLFLFMLTHFSNDPDIASIVTTIWYSLHLSEKTYKILMESLQILVATSSSNLKELSHGTINVSLDNLEVLKQVWQGWLNVDQQEPSWRSVSLSIQRKQMFTNDPRAAEGMESYCAMLPRRHKKSAVSWVDNGDFLPSGMSTQSRYENPTLTGKRSSQAGHGVMMRKTTFKDIIAESKKTPNDVEFLYCIMSDLMPFGEWDYLEASRFSNDDSLIVMYHAYITNQIQQVIEFIQENRLHTGILLGTCLAITEDEVNGEKFDRIFTSNISDYVGTKTLLNVMKPLLSTENKNAVIVTQNWNWIKFFEMAYADHPMYLLDGSWNKWIAAARKDTGADHSIRPRHWYQEYFNNTSYFVDYLRADLMACNRIHEVEDTQGKVATFQQVKGQCSGLRMRDFRQRLNKVVPWRYRCNARAVNMLPGISRMLEWYIG